MIDTHAHLTDRRFNPDRDSVIQRALHQGITLIICVCSDFGELDLFYSLLEKYNFLYGAAGIHPHDAFYWKDLEPKLIKALEHEKIVALGEVGLDYHYENSPRTVQKEVFKFQLELAKEKGFPVIIHSRDAMKDTLAILRGEKIHKGVMHCFSGNEEDMRTCLELGLYISLAGTVTFPKAFNLQKIASSVPLDKLVVETDCPYLAPQPVRGKRNEPSFLKYVIEKIASIRGLDQRKLTLTTSENAKNLFGLMHKLS